MLILAFESSAKPASVAIYEVSDTTDIITDNNGKLLGMDFQNSGFSHSRTLLLMAESLMKSLDIKPTDIGLVAVANGPGSFTGVRIGVSAAKGLAWGLDIPVCGVSTLEAIAAQTPENGVIICPVMDARREQVYNALFKWENDVLVRLCDDRAISIEELAADLIKYDLPCLLAGDGADVCKVGFDRFDNLAAPDYRIANESMRYQTALGVALTAVKSTPVNATELEPFYLRPSQAERERQNRT